LPRLEPGWRLHPNPCGLVLEQRYANVTSMTRAPTGNPPSPTIKQGEACVTPVTSVYSLINFCKPLSFAFNSSLASAIWLVS
jgi:hypothetical protein